MEEKKFVIEITENEAKYMYHTTCGSFYNKYGGSERFSVLVNNGFDIKSFSNDSNCTMHFTDTYINALIVSKILSNLGFKSVVLCDEYIIYEDGTIADEEYIILVNKKFKTGLDRNG